jgi:hypothetical protein
MDRLPSEYYYDELPEDAVPLTPQRDEPTSAPARAATPVATVPDSYDELPEGAIPIGSSMGSIAGRAAVRGMREGISGVSDSGTVAFGNARKLAEKERAPSDDPELDKLLSQKIFEGWSDPNWLVAQITHGLTASSPTLGGAFIGGAAGSAAGPVGALGGAAVGGGIGAAVQTLGPAYLAARQEGKDHEDAVKQALVETGLASAFGAAMGLAPGVSAFGRTAEGALVKPVSEALLQIFGVQPGLMTAQHAATAGATGKEITAEDLLQTAVLGTATGAAITGVHQALPGRKAAPPVKPKAAVEEVPATGPDTTQTAALAPEAPPVETEAPPITLKAMDPEEARQRIREAMAGNQPPKGTGTGTAPPPAADATVQGNPDSAPTRSETQYPKGTGKKAKEALDRVRSGKNKQPVAEPPAAPSEVPADVAAALERVSGKPATPMAPEEATAIVQNASGAGERLAESLTATPEALPTPQPEAPKTLDLQQQKLIAGEVPAQMFTPGEPELPLPPGMKRVETAKGVFHYNPKAKFNGKALSEGKLRALVDRGEENQILGLGDKTKAQVGAEAAATSDNIVAAVERSQDGTEVKAAAATESDAPRIAEQIQENASPGHTVAVEPAAPVVEARKVATGTPSTEPARSEVKPISDTHIQFGKARIEVQSDGIGYRGLNDKSTIFYAKGKGPGTRRGGEASIDQMAERGVPEALRPIFDDYAHGRIDKATVVERLRALEAEYKAKAPEPVVPTRAEKPNPSGDFQDMGGQAIADNMYAALWTKVAAGSVVETGNKPSPLLQAAKMVRDAGGLKTIEDFKAFAKEYADARSGKSGPEFQSAMRALVDKWSPKAPEPAAAPPVTKADKAKAVSKQRSEPKPPEETGPKVLRPADEIAKDQERDAALARGFRAKDDNVAPDFADKKAQDRFVRLAAAAVADLKEQAPEYYRAAVEAAGQRTRGNSSKNAEHSQTINDAWQRMYEAEQAGTPRYKPKGAAVGKVEKEIRKAERESAKGLEKKEKAPKTVEQLEAEQKKAKSKQQKGYSEGSATRESAELNEQITSTDSSPLSDRSLTPEEALIEKQRIIREENGIYDEEDAAPSAARNAPRRPSQSASNVDIEAIKARAAERAKAREPAETTAKITEVKNGERKEVEVTRTTEGRRVELSAEDKAAYLERLNTQSVQKELMKLRDAEAAAQAGSARKGPRTKDNYEDELQRARDEVAEDPKKARDLADKLNGMTDEQFADWYWNASRDERLMAQAAHELKPLDILSNGADIKAVLADGYKRAQDRIIGDAPAKKLAGVMGASLHGLRQGMGSFNRAMVRLFHDRLVRLIGDMNVRRLSDKQMRDLARLDGIEQGDVAGMYARNRNEILLNNDYQQAFQTPTERYWTVMHEALHGALSTMLDNPRFKAFSEQVENLRRFVERKFNDDAKLRETYDGHDVRYALSNIHEFTSGIMENTMFREVLGQIELTPRDLRELGMNNLSWGGRIKHGLNTFIELIRGALGMPEGSRSALEMAIVSTEKALRQREMIGEGARFSKGEGANDYARLSNDEYAKRFEHILRSKFVDRDVAETLSKILMEELGDKATIGRAMPLINQLAKEYGNPLQGRPGSKKSAKIQQSQQEARDTAQGKAPPPPATLGQTDKSLWQRITGKFTKSDTAEKLREELVNYNRPVEKLGENVAEKLGRNLTDEENFSDQKRLMEPKITGALRRFEVNQAREIEDVLRAAKKANMDEKAIAEALIAYHAEERNAYIEQKNGTKNGSGMTDARAQEILKGIEGNAAKKAVFERLTKLNDELREFALNNEEGSGLRSKDQANGLRKMFKKYTSLSGFADEKLAEAMGGDDSLVGRQGLSVLGREGRETKGRKTLSENPLYNMVQQATRSIERAERNRVLVSAGEAFRRAGFAKGDGVYVAENIGGTPARTIREAMLDPRILGFKEEGVQKFLVFDDAETAAAFERLSPENLHYVLDKAVNVLNKVKNLWTHYSPEFLIRHFVFRYPIEGAMNLKGLKELGLETGAMRYFKDSFSYIADVNRYLQGSEVKDAKVAKYIKEMEENGGIVSFRNISDTLDIKKQAARIDSGKVNKFAEFHEAWDRTLTAMDSAQRLALYIRAREADITPQRAAILARDATVDFARKGKSAGLLSVWSAFGNVAIQTTTRMGKAFAESPNYRRTIAGIVAAGAAIELANYMLGGNDKDGTPWIEKIPSYERIQNMILFVPGENDKGMPRYVKVPLPYPLFGVWPSGSAMTQAVMNQLGVSKMGAGEIGMRVAHGMAETLTPFGRNVGNMTALATPEVVRWMTELSQNKDWKGDAIYTSYPKKGMAPSEQGRTSTDEGWKMMARGLAKIGIDTYPEAVKHIVDQYVGAQRRFVAGAAGAASDVASGDFKPNQIPGVRLVYGEVDKGKADRGRMYNLENKSEVSPAERRALQATQNGGGNATDRALAQAAARRTGMEPKQLLAVNSMFNDVKRYDKEVRAAPQGSKQRDAAEKKRQDFLAGKMKELNDLGVRGGIDKH